MKSALDHIRLARRELLTERARIDQEIAVLDDVIRRLSGEEEAEAVTEARSVKDIALSVAASGKVFSLQDVVEAAKSEGSPAKYESISSVLSRLGKEGVLNRGPRRGTYVLAKSEASTEVEASGETNWTSADTDGPDQEGATDDHHRGNHPAPVTGASQLG